MDDTYAIAAPHNEIYANIFAEFNPHGAPRVNAAEAAGFLKKSNLPMTTLGQIWELADSSKIGSLDKRGAFVAFKLVAAAQNGKSVASASLYDSSIPSPRFVAPPQPPLPPATMQHHFQPAFPSAGRAPPIPPPAVSQFASSASSQQSSPLHTSGTFFPPTWPITPLDQAKYDSIFDSLNPIGGKLSGANVRPVLMNSGLDPVSLARIWELSDQDKDGQLDRIEMSIALHLVYRSLQNEPIPTHLPPNLIHPSKAMYAQRSPNVAYSLSRAGSVASLDDANMSQSYSATLPLRAAQQPRAYSAQPNMTSGTSTPQLAVSSSIQSLNALNVGEWPVNTGDYAAQFIQCDTNSDGLVDGLDVRLPLLQTGIDAPILAHIWSLVDFRKCGQLNLEQFSLIMHLVEAVKRGESPPIELPTRLIPPTFREPSIPKTSVTVNQSVSTPQMSEATSMELADALKGENDELKLLAEAIQAMIVDRKAAEENVIQLEADMTLKNSKIKNLQVELETLESTVKQLERQKIEANRRLTDYDTQIEQLEAACKAQREKREDTEKRMKQIEEDAKNAAESKLNDEQEMEELRKEIGELCEKLQHVNNEVIEEVGEREKMVTELTSIERREGRDTKQSEILEAEIETIKKVTDEIVAAVEKDSEEMEKILVSNPQLLRTQLNHSLLSDDTIYGEPSTSINENHIQQPPDPFAAAKNTTADPFAQVDPFASQGSFAAAFPADPFTQGFPTEAAFAAPSSQPAAAAASGPGASKPVPPRPAPPKSARATPVADPFAPSQGDSTTQSSNNFANFADFGSAFN